VRRRLRAIVNDAIKPYPSSTSVGSGLTGRYAVLIGIDDPLTPGEEPPCVARLGPRLCRLWTGGDVECVRAHRLASQGRFSTKPRSYVPAALTPHSEGVCARASNRVGRSRRAGSTNNEKLRRNYLGLPLTAVASSSGTLLSLAIRASPRHAAQNSDTPGARRSRGRADPPPAPSNRSLTRRWFGPSRNHRPDYCRSDRRTGS
jgi:hypothetical protein